MGLLSSLLERKFDVAEESKELVKQVYLSDNRPWVIGYSGGKDSTAVVQLVFQALMELPRQQLHKKVYVISSDTLVENPLVIRSIDRSLWKIESKAKSLGLPIKAQKVRPLPDKSFWVNIIGRGYPTPTQTFRWCTDRLKIEPANRFITDKVSEHGEVIVVLGVREGESATRTRSIKEHSIEGNVLMKHSTLANAFVFAPIREFTTDDVWEYLLSVESPWGGDNHELNRLYRDSAGDECPLVIDHDTKKGSGIMWQ